MSVIIEESNLLFGEYEESNLFRVEKSKVYKSLGENVRVVEFVLHRNDNEFLLIEAKSSSPKPGNQNDFDTYINEITDKFVHTVDLYFSLVVKRLADNEGEMPDSFKTADYTNAKIKLLLVINGHEIKWLPPISEALKTKMKRHIKNWRLDIGVINHEQAFEYGLLKNN